MVDAFVVAEGALAVGSVALSAAHLRRLQSVAPPNVATLLAKLRATPRNARAELLARHARTGSWEQRLSLALNDPTNEATRADVVAELVRDADESLSLGEGWPSAALRILGFGSLLILVLSAIARRFYVMPELVIVAAAAFCLNLGLSRAASQRAREERRALDALVDVLADASVRTRAPAPKVAHKRRRRWR